MRDKFYPISSKNNRSALWHKHVEKKERNFIIISYRNKRPILSYFYVKIIHIFHAYHIGLNYKHENIGGVYLIRFPPNTLNVDE